MKKISKLFSKKKRNANFYSLCHEPLTDSNISSTENTIVTNCYKSFQFDCCCYENAVVLRNNQPQKAETYLCSNSSTLPLNSSHLKSIKSGKKFLNKDSVEVEQLKPRTSCSLDSDSSDISIIDEMYIKTKEPINCPISNEAKKSPQKTVNINGSVTSNKQKFDALNNNYNNIVNSYINKLLNSKQKLSEDNITLIALYMDHRWKDFGKNLGFEEEFLEDLEECSDSRAIAVYDSLQKFVKQFPNTTLGFVTSLLKQNNQMGVIEKLAQKNALVS